MSESKQLQLIKRVLSQHVTNFIDQQTPLSWALLWQQRNRITLSGPYKNNGDVKGFVGVVLNEEQRVLRFMDTLTVV